MLGLCSLNFFIKMPHELDDRVPGSAGREESALEAGPLLKWQIYSRLYQEKRKAASVWLGHWVELGFCAADWDVEEDGDNPQPLTVARIGEIEADFWCGDNMLAPSARMNAKHVVNQLLLGDAAAWNSFGASGNAGAFAYVVRACAQHCRVQRLCTPHGTLSFPLHQTHALLQDRQ